MRKLLWISVIFVSIVFWGLSDNLVYGAPPKAEKPAKSVSEKTKGVSKTKPGQKEVITKTVALPDGLVGRRYSHVVSSEEIAPPYKVSISGMLPPGLKFDQRTGGIEGEPTDAGEWKVTVNLVGDKNKKDAFTGIIRVFRKLTVGEHGTFKGVDGIQMALNMAKDMDEITIEQGTYGISGLVIPNNKVWEHGIKISGGWNETFTERNNDPQTTIFDGEGKKSRILTLSNSKGGVAIENLTFTNSGGGAVKTSRQGVFKDCVFTNNEDVDEGNGGAVSGGGTFQNCTFSNNRVTTKYIGGEAEGGAVSGDGIFQNCTFIDNKAINGSGIHGSGGAVSGGGTFTNCTFANNKASEYGGAVDTGKAIFQKCTFVNNSAIDGGGAVCIQDNVVIEGSTFIDNSTHGGGGAIGTLYRYFGSAKVDISPNINVSISNSIFTNNSSEGKGGAILSNGTFIDSTFTNNKAGDSGGAIMGSGTFANSTFANNSAKNNGGAIAGGGFFTNSIFINNSSTGNSGAVFGNGDFLNSTFYGNNGGAINGGGNIINSIFYKNVAEGKDHDITVNGNITIDYSLLNYLKGAANYGDHNIMGDPKFADADKGDFHLSSDSPCINTGKPFTGKVTLQEELKLVFRSPLDLAGKGRVSDGKIDMGAYEWQGKVEEERRKVEEKVRMEAEKARIEEAKAKFPQLVFSDLIVLDKKTELMWTRDGNIAGKGMNWKDAFKFVERLNAEKYAGYSDWRLPNGREFETLLNFAERQGYEKNIDELFNKIGFKNVQSDFYWSYATYTGNKLGVSMGGGSVGDYDGTSNGYVWLVRAGQ